MELWFSGIFYCISGVSGVLFLKTTVIKKLFMHGGCVPYRTMHPDAECLGGKK